MTDLRTHRDLDVWKLSLDWVEAVYRSSAAWPPDERFGLISQVRRAAVSVAANIAEDQLQPLLADTERIARMLSALSTRLKQRQQR